MNPELILRYFFCVFLIYLGLVNLFAVIVTTHDKRISRLPRGSVRRVPEKTFLLFSMLGGGIGTLCTMLLIRHKTKNHKLLVLKIALLALLWLALAVLLAQKIL